MLKIFIDDDDHDDDGDDGDDGDDDDVVERTRTGPSAARSDLEHQVNHNAKISNFYHVFSSYEEGGPRGAGQTRRLAVLLRSFTCFLRICGRFSHVLLGVNITHFTCSNPYVLYLWYINPRLNAFEHFFLKG